MTTFEPLMLNQRAEGARLRRASSRCRPHAGSSRCGPAPRTSRRAARRDGRATCRPGARTWPDRPEEGSKRMFMPCATGKPSSAISSFARSRRRRRAIHSATTPWRLSREGESAMSTMLTPVRPSASAISAMTPGRLGTEARSSCTAPPARPAPSSASRPARAALVPLGRSGAGAAGEQRRAPAPGGRRGRRCRRSARRCLRGRCRSRSRCWRRRRGWRRGSSARPPAACPSPRSRAVACGLGDEEVREHMRKMRDARHQAVVCAGVDRRRARPEAHEQPVQALVEHPGGFFPRGRQVPGRALEEVGARVLDAGALGPREGVAADEPLVGRGRRHDALGRARRR